MSFSRFPLSDLYYHRAVPLYYLIQSFWFDQCSSIFTCCWIINHAYKLLIIWPVSVEILFKPLWQTPFWLTLSPAGFNIQTLRWAKEMATICNQQQMLEHFKWRPSQKDTALHEERNYYILILFVVLWF